MDVRGVSARLRVLIAEDQYLTREGTRRLLEERDELEVVGWRPISAACSSRRGGCART